MAQTKTAKVVSLGWFGHHNCGDEAFKVALQKLFPSTELIFINNLTNNVDLINGSDYLLIGGGNIVTTEFLKGLDKITIPYSFIGVGWVGAPEVNLLRKAEHILVRDLKSLSDLVVRSTSWPIELIPDITFCLEPNKKEGGKFIDDLKFANPNLPLVGVFLNDCVSARFDSTILKFVEAEKVKLELARWLEELSVNVLFIPMSYAPPDDRRISLDVIGKMFKGYRCRCITNELEPEMVLNVASVLDVAVTMRLHASIFCTIAGIPFIDLLHHDKNKNYLQTINHGKLGVDYYELSIRSLRDKWEYIDINKEEISRSLLNKTQKNRVLLGEKLKNVCLP